MKLFFRVWALPVDMFVAAAAETTDDHGGNYKLRGRKLSDFDCEKGCGLNRNVMGPPVCGDDGFTYYNECLAVCQGVSIVRPGACPGDPPEEPASFDEDWVVGLDVMKKFQEENFKFISKRKFLPLPDDYVFEDSGIVEEEDTTLTNQGLQISRSNGNGNSGGKGNGSKGNGKAKIHARRVTEEGFEFMAEFDEEELAGDFGVDLDPFSPSEHPEEDPSDHPEEDPDSNGPEDRKLGIYGGDTRYQINDYWAYPNRIVGELDYDNNEGGCSGTVVSRTAVVTAGHCVYSNKDRRWLPHSKFAPARYRSSWWTNEPYGHYSWKTMTTFSRWTQNGERSYDMAVINYHPSGGYEIGDRVGYAGFSRTNWYDSKLDSANIRGYPYDKPDGTMWASGSCTHTYYSGNYLTKHYCDTVGAMSGSSVMSSSGYIYGIHVAGSYYDRDVNDQVRYNIAVILYGTHYDKLKEWSGR